ncbi:MAG: hypothetical protein AB8D78_06110 [Akkermansiaceae bacterium]
MSIHVTLSPEAAKKLQAQQRYSKILSVVIACLLIVLVAGVFSYFTLKMAVIESPTIVTYEAKSKKEEEVQKKKVQREVQRKPSAPAQHINKVIAATTASPMTIPVPEIAATQPSLDFGDAADFGQGWSNGKAGTTGSLFGRTITSANLGVVLDVSGSAHAHLDKAIAEIDKNFPTAHMILVVGCGMSDGKAAIKGGGGKVPGKPRVVAYNDTDSEKEYNRLGRSVPAQMESFFKRVGKERAKELRKYFEARGNLYVLYGGDIHAANFAFEFVLDINVDTIYWFADFADRIDEKTIEDLTKRLSRNNVTAIAHNFLGKSVAERAKEMVKKTGGQTIEVIPGEK